MNQRLDKKIKELENTIENLKKRIKINDWKSEKAMKKKRRQLASSLRAPKGRKRRSEYRSPAVLSAV